MKQETTLRYDDRIVLFLDILGFCSTIDKTMDKETENTANIRLLYNTLKGIGEFVTNSLNRESSINIKSITPNKTISVTQFSDSIVVSFINNDNHSTLLTLLRTIRELVMHLINNGILCRGAISYGKLIHDDHVIFGSALNDAYETESEAAIYPRIILDRSLLRYGKINNSISKTREKELLAYLIKDTDEKYYINYFLDRILGYQMAGINPQTYLSNLRQIIEINLSNTKPNIKIKYGWMKNKYNKLLKKLQDTDKIQEISTVAGLFDYINGLKLISK